MMRGLLTGLALFALAALPVSSQESKCDAHCFDFRVIAI